VLTPVWLTRIWPVHPAPEHRQMRRACWQAGPSSDTRARC